MVSSHTDEGGQSAHGSGAAARARDAGLKPCPTILVVEDDPQGGALFASALLRGGYWVVSASDGRDAVRTVARGGIDLIVTDLHLPHMDGIELVTKLRQAGKTIPIIVISGAFMGTTRHVLHAAELLGAQLALEKPFPLSRLVDAAHRLVGPPTPRTIS